MSFCPPTSPHYSVIILLTDVLRTHRTYTLPARSKLGQAGPSRLSFRIKPGRMVSWSLICLAAPFLRNHPGAHECAGVRDAILSSHPCGPRSTASASARTRRTDQTAAHDRRTGALRSKARASSSLSSSSSSSSSSNDGEESALLSIVREGAAAATTAGGGLGIRRLGELRVPPVRGSRGGIRRGRESTGGRMGMEEMGQGIRFHEEIRRPVPPRCGDAQGVAGLAVGGTAGARAGAAPTHDKGPS